MNYHRRMSYDENGLVRIIYNWHCQVPREKEALDDAIYRAYHPEASFLVVDHVNIDTGIFIDKQDVRVRAIHREIPPPEWGQT